MAGWQPPQYDPRQHQRRIETGQQAPPQSAAPYPPLPSAPPAQPRRPLPRPHKVFYAGIGLIALAVASFNTDLIAGLQNSKTGGVMSLSASHGLCASPLGQFAQSLSAAGAGNCSKIGTAYAVTTWALWIGIALTLVGVAVPFLREYRAG